MKHKIGICIDCKEWCEGVDLGLENGEEESGEIVSNCCSAGFAEDGCIDYEYDGDR